MREQVEGLEDDADVAPHCILVDARAVTSWPQRRIRPRLTGSSKLTQRSNVDLPDPDAPMRQIDLMGRHRQVDSAQNLEIAERLVDVLEPDRLLSRAVPAREAVADRGPLLGRHPGVRVTTGPRLIAPPCPPPCGGSRPGRQAVGEPGERNRQAEEHDSAATV